MLGRRRGVGGRPAAKSKAISSGEEKPPNDYHLTEKDDDLQLTEKELADFRQQADWEEREERLRRSLEVVSGSKSRKSGAIEHPVSHGEGGKPRNNNRSKAFSWMDDEDVASEDEERSRSPRRDPTNRDHRELPVLHAVSKAAGARPVEEPSGASLPAVVVHPTCLTGREHLLKTRLCVRHEQGFCQFGPNCNFAHGQAELRAKTFTSNPGPALYGVAKSSGISRSPILLLSLFQVIAVLK